MFAYSGNDFYCEQVPLADLAAHVGTPAYVYSSETILTNFRAYDEAFGDLPHTVCYAVKANSSLAILAMLSRAGAGFDIVSGGELFRVLQAGGDPAKIVFSGVGKTPDEIEYALGHGIHTFNCESEAELALLDAKAERLGLKAGFAIRVNPDVDASTHPYISTGLHQHKFGIAIQEAPAVYERAKRFRNLAAEGVSCHIGSQILDPAPIFEALDKALALAAQLRAEGSPIRHLDLGGRPRSGIPRGRDRAADRSLHCQRAGTAARLRAYRHGGTGPLHRGAGRRAAGARAVPQAQWR